MLLGVLAGAATRGVGGRTPPSARVVTVAVLLVAYFAGGYVTGRLARFDGARNGFLSWVSASSPRSPAVVAAFLGARVRRARRVLAADPAVGLAEQVTVAELVLAAVAVLGTLLAAVLGGKAGEQLPPPR